MLMFLFWMQICLFIYKLEISLFFIYWPKKDTSDFQVNIACFKTNIQKMFSICIDLQIYDLSMICDKKYLSMICDKKAHDLFNV